MTTNDIDARKFRCNNCDRVETINSTRIAPAGEQARVAGWRLGTDITGPISYCPECTGINEDYWDDRTLTMAYAAGIDAGNTAWGQE